MGRWWTGHSTLTNIEGYLAAAGTARLEGDTQVLQRLMACLGDFDQYFEIMPGTKPAPSATSP